MENNIKTRKAKPGDLHDVYRFICELENQQHDFNVFRTIYIRNLKDPLCYYYLAFIKKQPVAFISFHIQHLLHHCGKVGEIQELYVDNNFRNMGIGKILVKEIDRISKINDLKSIEVTSNRKRIDNIKIYEKLGFVFTHNKLTKVV